VCGGLAGEAASDCRRGVGETVSSLSKITSVGKTRSGPKRLYRPARLGNDYFATWGATTSTAIARDTAPEKGIDVALHGRERASTLSRDELDRRMRQVQLAKAEFYYDPRRGGPIDATALRDEALWNLRWRARLRHVRQPNQALAAFFSGPGLAFIEAGGSNADVSGIVATVLAADPSVLASWAEKNVGPLHHSRATGGIVH
jgi:hypothetical protein